MCTSCPKHVYTHLRKVYSAYIVQGNDIICTQNKNALSILISKLISNADENIIVFSLLFRPLRGASLPNVKTHSVANKLHEHTHIRYILHTDVSNLVPCAHLHTSRIWFLINDLKYSFSNKSSAQRITIK